MKWMFTQIYIKWIKVNEILILFTDQGRNGQESGILENSGRNKDKEMKRRRVNEPTDGDNYQKMMDVTKIKLQNEAENMLKESYNLRRYALLNNTLNKYSCRF